MTHRTRVDVWPDDLPDARGFLAARCGRLPNGPATVVALNACCRFHAAISPIYRDFGNSTLIHCVDELAQPNSLTQWTSPLNQKNWRCRRAGSSYFHFNGLASLL